ncbi:hypothetical protein CISG_02445 [Coccidioides immitis RMSCC 3703]|uniref:Uncharacterized protein n=1 Tax=Coccidioides immitis RMSCC 3703 TaxID=454286 RepID=A0A0J8R895_COCIT|nr:hypothetical protein CISG_02445 [Coccidioides immitis RMSCC 3703]
MTLKLVVYRHSQSAKGPCASARRADMHFPRCTPKSSVGRNYGAADKVLIRCLPPKDRKELSPLIKIGTRSSKHEHMRGKNSSPTKHAGRLLPLASLYTHKLSEKYPHVIRTHS